MSSQFAERTREEMERRHDRRDRRELEEAIKRQKEADEKAMANALNMAKNKAHAFADAIGQFRAMMEIAYPGLAQLASQHAEPESSDDFPASAILTEKGPAWGRALPEGWKEGQALVWHNDAWRPDSVSGGYDGEFALYLDETTLKVKKGTVCINGYSVSFQNDISVCNVGSIEANSSISVYLCAYQRLNNAGAPVREDRSGLPVRFTALVETSTSGDGVRGYIKLGEYSADGGIVQDYLGGTGAQITVSLPGASMDNQILKWNAQTETWQPGWLTAVSV